MVCSSDVLRVGRFRRILLGRAGGGVVSRQTSLVSRNSKDQREASTVRGTEKPRQPDNLRASLKEAGRKREGSEAAE